MYLNMITLAAALGTDCVEQGGIEETAEEIITVKWVKIEMKSCAHTLDGSVHWWNRYEV